MQTNFLYLTFTDDTNITTPPIPSPMIPIKFAPTPFSPITAADLVWTDSFENYPLGTYPPNSFSGAWTVLANSVQIVTNPPAADGSKLLQLDNGAVFTTLPTVAGQEYLLTYQLGSKLAEGGAATNANWQTHSFTFTAAQANTPLVLNASGTTLAGANAQTLTFDTNALLDAFALTEVPGDLYYQPEQDLTPLVGTSAYGLWTLEIQDDRVGATNNCVLDSWQLSFVFANTNPAPANLTPGNEICNNIPANGIVWYAVSVPFNAIAATNTLFSSDQPVNLLINTNSPDTTGSVLLFTSQASTNYVLGTNSVPLLVPGSTYYLGVQNTDQYPDRGCLHRGGF